MPQFAGALRQRRQHGVAVRDRLIPRQGNAAREELRRANRLFFHEAILARRFAAAPRGKRENLSSRPVFYWNGITPRLKFPSTVFAYHYGATHDLASGCRYRLQPLQYVH